MTDPLTAAHSVVVDADSHLNATSPTLRIGLYTGALLTTVMIGSLFAANRFPLLDNRALERNGASYGLFLLFMMIPIFRFLHQPVKMFASAMIGWCIFVIAYDAAGMYFHTLFSALRTPVEALLEGTIVYGVCAVGFWVGSMALHARQHRIVPRRRRTDFFSSHHR